MWKNIFRAIIDWKNLEIPRIHNLVRLYQFDEGFLINQIEIKELMASESVYTSSRYTSKVGMIASVKPPKPGALELYAMSIFEAIIELID